MIHRLPTNCRQKLFHLWARLHTDTAINEVIPLNHAELCESVVFLHSQCSLTVCMNDPQTADELPTKIISFVGEAVNRRILTMLMNDSHTADELPTKIIPFVGEAGHSRNHK